MIYRNCIRSVVVSILCFEIALGSRLLANPTEPQDSGLAAQLRREVVSASKEPSLEKLEAISKLLIPSQKSGNIADLLDQDPFYLRSQDWNQQSEPTTTLQSRSTTGGLEVKIPGAAHAWRLHQAFETILATPEWIILKPSAQNLPLQDLQGFFVVGMSDLYAAAQDQDAAPIYFFPLPGDGWGSDTRAQEIPHLDLIVFQSASGDRLPISKNDIKKIVHIERLNLHLAVQEQLNRTYLRLAHASDETLSPLREQIVKLAQALRQDFTGTSAQSSYAAGESAFAQILRPTSEGHQWLPERGSTAYFGLYYAGIWTTGAVASTGADSNFTQTAFATDNVSASPYTATDRVVHSAKILGIAFVGTIILKYTFLRKEANRRAEAYREAGIRNPHVRVSLDLYAHTLTVLGLAGNIWPTNMMEYLMDRMRLAENAKFRRLFNETFGRTRATSSATPVNARTLIDGVLIIGSVDIAGVIYQYTYWNPPLGRFIGRLLEPLWPEARTTMETAFAPTNASSSNYNVIEFVRNGIAYVLTGAYGYAHDVQDNATNEGTRIVRDQMKEEGIDPNLSANEPELRRRVNLYVREKLAQQGLPDEKAFWYDANSIYYRVLSLFGYTTPEAIGDAPAVASEQYLALRRTGLVGRALRLAIQDLEAKNVVSRSSETDQALIVLRRSQVRFSLLRRFLDKPTDFLSPRGLITVAREYRQVRSEIVPLTQEAPLTDLNISSHPWVLSTGSEGAAHAYRKAFLALLGRNESSSSEAEGTESSATRRLDPMIHGSPFERWQLRRAWNRAEGRLLRETGVSITAAIEDGEAERPEIRERWRELFKAEVLRAVTLYPDYTEKDLIERVSERAEAKFRERTNPEQPEGRALNSYLAELSSLDRNRVTETLKADFFATEYVELTQNQEQVPAMSPAQPGRFQWIRQTRLIRKNAMATQAIRFFESPFSDTRYERGLWNMLARDYLPLADDMVVAGFTRNLRKLPYALTFGYIIGANVWLSAQPYALMPLQNVIMGASVAGMWVTTMRIMKKMGWKPGLSRTKMLGFAIIGSCLTFTTPIWLNLFLPAYNEAIHWGYTQGHELFDKAFNGVRFVGQACSTLLTR